MLHTLSHSPFQCDFSTVIRYLQSDDEILLMQDGVIAGLEGTKALETLLSSGVTVFVLQPDVAARGLSAQISTAITSVSYTDFVRLAIKHPQQMAW